MARARNIKPAFFTNDKLSECSPLARLLFIGLWTICDREGRLFDRPKKIKAEILPYDDCNADLLLSELHNNGFIVRYKVGMENAIEIINFIKHQNPHQKEPVSVISSFKDGGAEIQSQEKTGLVQEKTGLVLPYTESPILNTSSPLPYIESPILNVESKDSCHLAELQDAVNIYNQVAENVGLPKCQLLTDQRKKSLEQRLKDAGGIEGWKLACEKLENSDFLIGKKTDWKASFDFMLQKKSFIKLMEGSYQNHESSKREAHDPFLERLKISARIAQEG